MAFLWFPTSNLAPVHPLPSLSILKQQQQLLRLCYTLQLVHLQLPLHLPLHLLLHVPLHLPLHLLLHLLQHQSHGPVFLQSSRITSNSSSCSSTNCSSVRLYSPIASTRPL